MKRADKIRLAQQEIASVNATRDESKRNDARREWADTRRAAREAYLAGKEWQKILDAYKQADGFYTKAEREKMCREFTEQLINRTFASG